MRLLLDTHALLWWLDGDRRLSVRARRLIGDETNAVLVSAASAWEITTKFRLGKLPGAADVAADVLGCVAGQGFLTLDISVLHAQRAGGLPGLHRNPFDRMLVAQAQLEDIAIVSDDAVFDGCGVRRVW
ncbi:MAG TPA: type II toxin-antitoxin system VapC family toxin [Vicinamibacterales bacterium]|nr:type II toxin-antitoxin system VapC family toxin [Vicinamibacterales bacterium]